MVLGSERQAVQEPFLRYAQEVGWVYLPQEEVRRLRRGQDGLLLYDIFLEKVQQLNPGVVDLQRAEELAKRLSGLRPSIEGNLEAWEYLKSLKTAYVPEERREFNISLIDTDQPEENAFHVTDKLGFQSRDEPLVLDDDFKTFVEARGQGLRKPVNRLLDLSSERGPVA